MVPKKKTAQVDVEIVEIDPTKLTTAEARKRCEAIYDLERVVDKKQNLFNIAKGKAKIAKDALGDAQAALSQEISEQRFGPGPLFPNDGEQA